MIKGALVDLAKNDKKMGISERFQDTSRVNRYSYDIAQELFLDFSKTHLSKTLLNEYEQIATQLGFENKRKGLFLGEKINNSEQRAVLHTLLRQANPDYVVPPEVQRKEAEKAQLDLKNIYRHCQALIEQYNIKDIVHIGIGGSVLGPQLVYQALEKNNANINVHFLSNVDAHQWQSIKVQCKPKTTLVIGVSKTFSTRETLQNISLVKKWYTDNGVSNNESHFIAVTANLANAQQQGFSRDKVAVFPEWVGGRYSVWSAVSLSVILCIGYSAYADFLSGAAQVDSYFYKTSLKENACFVSAVLDHYYHNYFDAQSRAIFPYDYRCRCLVDYLQQLETESNGKDRNIDGNPVSCKTSSVIWGGVGTDVQHSVFQMLHQGTHVTPAEFIFIKEPDHKEANAHKELLANGLAQTAALLQGQNFEQAKTLLDKNTPDYVAKAKIFSGEKPSTSIILQSLTPKSLGGLLAFYEHRTFSLGVLCGINSFDQMGVELGKKLARELRPYFDEDQAITTSSFDDSTLKLVKRLQE